MGICLDLHIKLTIVNLNQRNDYLNNMNFLRSTLTENMEQTDRRNPWKTSNIEQFNWFIQLFFSFNETLIQCKDKVFLNLILFSYMWKKLIENVPDNMKIRIHSFALYKNLLNFNEYKRQKLFEIGFQCKNSFHLLFYLFWQSLNIMFEQHYQKINLKFCWVAVYLSWILIYKCWN